MASDADRTVTTYDESGAITSTRPYTAAENAAADAEQAQQLSRQVADQLLADTASDEAKLEEAVAALATLLGDNTTQGSYRQLRQTITNQYSASVARALVDLLITHAQASRRVARQSLRQTRLTTGDTSSADVGPDL